MYEDVYEVEVRELTEQPVAVIRSRIDEDQAGTWFAAAYATLATRLSQLGVATVGLPFARCAKDANGFDAEAGLPVRHPIAGDDDLTPETLPGGSAATTWHRGAYATSDPAYVAIADWLEREGLEPAGAPWEIYHADPDAGVEETAWLTEVVQPFTR